MKFHRHIGIDYSGAADSDAPKDGLQVSMATRDHPPELVFSEAQHQNWTCRKMAEWLVEILTPDATPTVVVLGQGF